MRLYENRLWRVDVEREARRLYDPRDLFHRLSHVHDMLKNRGRIHDIECVVRKGHAEIGSLYNGVGRVRLWIVHEGKKAPVVGVPMGDAIVDVEPIGVNAAIPELIN